MINEIKTIVQNYLNNVGLCCLMAGTVVSDGIRITGTKPPIPMELVVGNLKDYVALNDTVKLIRNHGGKEYYIVEIIGVPVVTKDRTLSIEPITITEGMTISSIKIKDVMS